ncbi:MAG: archaetidylserine decarboxylase [Pseudomonadota bacterium]
MAGRLFAALQYGLPKYLLTALIYRVARIRHTGFKNWLITRFVDAYDVDLDDVEAKVPDDFRTFNDFFIRELKDGARPVDTDAASVVSPADGRLSQFGSITDGTIVQAKGRDYGVDELLAVDLPTAQAFRGGQFATIYLAPFNYHRVHAPVDGTLVAAHYVPGDLFSVNAATARHVPGLFRRNERLNLHFETDKGRCMVSLVGALNVGSISTPWTGEIRPRRKGVVESLPIDRHPVAVNKGDLLGWFNMGSTVILLLQDTRFDAGIALDATVRMGQRLGTRD